MATINSLANETLLRIFILLQRQSKNFNSSSLCHCSLVCQRWRPIAQTVLSERIYVKGDESLLGWLDWAWEREFFVKEALFVETEVSSEYYKHTGEGFYEELRRGLKGVERLSIFRSTLTLDPDLLDLSGPALTNLKHLHLQGVNLRVTSQNSDIPVRHRNRGVTSFLLSFLNPDLARIYGALSPSSIRCQFQLLSTELETEHIYPQLQEWNKPAEYIWGGVDSSGEMRVRKVSVTLHWPEIQLPPAAVYSNLQIFLSYLPASLETLVIDQ